MLKTNISQYIYDLISRNMLIEFKTSLKHLLVTSLWELYLESMYGMGIRCIQVLSIQLLKLTFYQAMRRDNLESELSLWKTDFDSYQKIDSWKMLTFKTLAYSNTTHLYIKNKQIRSKCFILPTKFQYYKGNKTMIHWVEGGEEMQL